LGPKSDLFYPLNEFYALSRLPLPSVIEVEGPDIPEPYRNLLAHDRDMTPTLEDAYGGRIELRVLNHSLREDLLSRQIVLTTEGKAVAFGAIKIYLQHFPPGARALVLEMKQPLGAILRSEAIAHNSHPAAYFRVHADKLINDALGLTGATLLYGRQNVLTDSAGHTLATVIEIMMP
jgi:chorismate-pyruvate lyase